MFVVLARDTVLASMAGHKGDHMTGRSHASRPSGPTFDGPRPVDDSPPEPLSEWQVRS
jgi:hypothetical protein